jgi:CheY-like chemotaxis protein
LGAAPNSGRAGKRRLSNAINPLLQRYTNIEKEKAMSASRKVLVVDDDPTVRKSIDRVLSNKGYAVITAQNGEEALRKLNEEKYDLVYTDIRMPGVDGLEVAEQLKARKPWTPVVIITGYGTDEAQARAKAAGVASFVQKPLSPAVIEDSARDALAVPAPQVMALPAAETKLAPESRGALLNIILFFAAPFIGLAYIVAFPFVGLGVIAVLAIRMANKNPTFRAFGVTMKNGAMILAAPALGLVYVALFPFIGLVSLLWLAGRALRGKV